MSSDTEIQDVTERPERAVLLRSYEVDAQMGDGRTVDVRIVPFGETAIANDGLGGVAKGVPYEEEWMPGVFANQLRAANRVLLNIEHDESFRGVVGHGTALREARDGYHGSFRLTDDGDGEKARYFVEQGVYGGVSLEAIPLKSVRSPRGIIQRVRGHLDKVALCRMPAFKSALVLALREDPILDEELLPIVLDPGLIDRCRRLGIRLPQRYQAHPDDTDTPASAGTSEDGTRPPIETSEVKEAEAQ